MGNQEARLELERQPRMWRNALGHERCDYVDEGPDTYVGRCSDGSVPRTMDGRRPIASRPRAWIVPYRPVSCTDPDDATFYCPHCDWNDYYCLCSALEVVGTGGDEDGTRYGRMVERRRRELHTFRVGDRDEMRIAPEKEKEAEEAADYVGTETATGAARSTGRVGPIAREGGAVAVDEGGELSGGSSMVGTQSMDEASTSGAADRSDAGRSGVGRSGELLLTTRIPSYGRELKERELYDWATAKEEGDVKVCCSWTSYEDAAAATTTEDDAVRRCCVWVRRRPKRTNGRRPASPTLTMRAGAEFDDDWEHECTRECDGDDRRCPLVAREAWKERQALLLAGRAEALRKQWKKEIPPGILYSTRRYEETMRLAFDRCGRLLRQPADLNWVERAQTALDIEAIEEDIVVAERELEERRRLVRDREAAVAAWDAEGHAALDVVRETAHRRKRRIGHDDELERRVSRRPKKKPKRFNF